MVITRKIESTIDKIEYKKLPPFEAFRRRDKRRGWKFMLKNYSLFGKGVRHIQQSVIVMFDGLASHGGLTDRFRGILTIYAYCKDHGLPFRLYHAFPFELRHFFAPNKYDWSIESKQISRNFWQAKVLFLRARYKTFHLSKEEEENVHISILNHEIAKCHKPQIHVYTNCYFAETRFAELFEELFVPTKLLQDRIEKCQQSIGGEYEAVVFRFQQLLGDFQEGDMDVLEGEAREQLIKSCIAKIESLYEGGYFQTKKLLVTSDSHTFLERANELDYVNIIPGNMVHMDFTRDADDDTYMKSFVDLLMLAKAKSITLLKTGQMYDSGFPHFASLLGNVRFSRIEW